MQNKTKTAVAVSTEIPAEQKNENQSLTIVKKKLTVAEKIDLISQFEAVQSKYDYLLSCKENLSKFDKSQNNFSGAKLVLKSESYGSDVTVSNPVIIEEMVKIAKMRLTEQLIKVEKEIEAFEI